MAGTWTKVSLPPMERIALASLAEKHGESDDATLARLIRDAVRRELVNAEPASRPQNRRGARGNRS